MQRQFHYSILAFATLCAAFLISTPAVHAQGRDAAGVLVDIVDEREIRDTQAVIGQLVATRRSQIAAIINGVATSVNFNVGNRVSQGQVLVKLDQSRLAIERRAAEALVKVAKAEIRVAEDKLRLAELAFERQEALRGSNAFSRSRYDDLKQSAAQARSEAEKARAELQTAQSSLDRVDYEWSHTTIKAPFDGIIIARQAQPGQYVNGGGTIGTLLDISNLEIEADVPGSIASGLKPGTKVTALFDGGIHKDVELRSIIPVQNVSTRTRPVRFTVQIGDLHKAHIAVGSTVTLQMPVSAPRKVIAVPKDALLQTGGNWSVYVVEDGKAMPRQVELGQAVSERIEVLSGLKGGEMVVVRGNERLRPGQDVEPLKVEAQQPAKIPAKIQG
ncbi:MAG: efflux RND transporter periplasmic adaptor subunit [Pseudomonadota bacterium]